jgi:ubiquinone/menaquinone biosynthesis C-methylase UbiE
VLNALCSFGVLQSKGQTYELAPVAKLLTGSYENLSSDYWEHLPVYLQEGTPYKKMDSVTDSENEYQSQVKALEWMMTPCAEYCCKLIPAKENASILDLGAGSGVWSYSYLKSNPSTNCTLVDWPAVLKVAKDSAAAADLGTRVNYIEGNYHEAQIPTDSFDMAILGNVTHIETPEGNNDLFTKISSALKEKGKLLIFDCYSDNPEGAIARSLYELGLGLRTQSGKVYSVETLQGWLTEHGFSDFDFHPLEVTPYTMGVLVATKR